MPSKVPVPSKGALRALRHLAIGTTCTVAFSTAIITEERRRRIRAVRVAVENARLIKAVSRAQYSAVVAATLDSDDEEAFRQELKNADTLGEIPRNIELVLTQRSSVASRDEVNASRMTGSRHYDRMGAKHLVESEGVILQDGMHGYGEAFQSQNDQIYTGLQPSAINDSCSPTIGEMGTPSHRPPKRKTSSSHQPLKKLNGGDGKSFPYQTKMVAFSSQPLLQSLTVKKPISPSKVTPVAPAQNITPMSLCEFSTFIKGKLDKIDTNDVQALDEVAKIYLQRFPDDWKTADLDPNLIEVALELNKACFRHKKMRTAAKILRTLIRSQLDDKSFMSFRPDVIIQHLLSTKEAKLLEQAIEIFCVKLKEIPKTHYPKMATIGKRLCEQAFSEKKYILIDKIYWQAQAWCPGNTAIAIKTLILTAQTLEDYEKVVDLFLRYLPKVSISRADFIEVCQAATKSVHLIENKKIRDEKVKAILQVAADVSKKGDFFFPSSLLSHALGDHWRVTNNFTTSKTLFEMLEKYVNRVKHPVVLYRAMIQICVEANQRHEIQPFLERPAAAKWINDIRTRGHLALGKAMDDNWAGVEEELQHMSSVVRDTSKDHEIVSASFTPILKLFASRHNITQTEQFLHRCVDLFNVVPDQYISNIMVGLYMNADELDTIPIWMKYARSKGLNLNASGFNAILSGLARKQNNAKLHHLYEQVKEIDASLVNGITLKILAGPLATRIAVRLLGVDQTNTIQKHLPKIETLKHDAHSTKASMIAARTKRKFKKVLQIYWAARANHVHLHSSVLDLAIQAATLQGGEKAENEVCDLLEDAQRDGQDIAWALPQLLVYRLRDANISRESINNIVRDAQSKLTARGLFLPIQAVTEAMAILVQRGHFLQAVNLWYALSQNESGERIYKPDIHVLTILLKAHIKTYNCNGIRWVAQKLVTYEIRSDKIFRMVLKTALKEVKAQGVEDAQFGRTSPEHLEHMRILLEESLRFVHNQGVVHMVESREEARVKVLDLMREATSKVGDDGLGVGKEQLQDGKGESLNREN